MKLTRPGLFTLSPILLALVACGPDRGAQASPEVEGTEEAPLSSVPAAQAAYDASLDLWSSDFEASLAKLDEAIELDPEFFGAHALYSYRQAYIYQNYDRSSEVIQGSLYHAERAKELAPEDFWAMSALGNHVYRVEKDYPRAYELYREVVEAFPDSVSPIRAQAYITRRQGRWDEAEELLNRAQALKPTAATVQGLAESTRLQRRWDEALEYYGRHAELLPNSTLGPSNLGIIPVYMSGDTGPWKAFLESRSRGFVSAKWTLAMIEEDYAGALALLDAAEAETFPGQYSINPKALLRVKTLEAMGDDPTASLQEARATVEAMLPDLDHDPRVHIALGEVYARLGMREEAIAEGMRAVELVPPELDALMGPRNVAGLAQIYAALGEAELAAERLAYLLSVPCDINPNWLRLSPDFAGIRDHPAFQALLDG